MLREFEVRLSDQKPDQKALLDAMERAVAEEGVSKTEFLRERVVRGFLEIIQEVNQIEAASDPLKVLELIAKSASAGHYKLLHAFLAGRLPGVPVASLPGASSRVTRVGDAQGVAKGNPAVDQEAERASAPSPATPLAAASATTIPAAAVPPNLLEPNSASAPGAVSPVPAGAVSVTAEPPPIAEKSAAASPAVEAPKSPPIPDWSAKFGNLAGVNVNRNRK